MASIEEIKSLLEKPSFKKEIDFKGMCKQFHDSVFVQNAGKSRPKLIVQAFDDEQIWSQIEQSLQDKSSGTASMRTRYKKWEKHAAETLAREAEKGLHAEEMSLFADHVEDSDSEEGHGDGAESTTLDDEDCLLDLEETDMGDEDMDHEQLDDEISDAEISKFLGSNTKSKNKKKKKEEGSLHKCIGNKTMGDLLAQGGADLDEDDLGNNKTLEDLAREYAEKKRGKSTSKSSKGEKSLSKKNEKQAEESESEEEDPKSKKKSNIKTVANMEDDGDFELVKGAKKNKTEVDDAFFSLREMEKFGEEGEALAGEGATEDADLFKMFYSNAIDDGEDIMFEDFFAPAKKRKNTDKKTEEKKSTDEEDSEEPEVDSDDDQAGNADDNGADDLSENEEGCKEGSEDFLKMGKEDGSSGEEEEEDMDDLEDAIDGERDKDGEMNEEEEDMDDESSSEESSKSWSEDEEEVKKFKKSVPFSGLDEDIDVDDIDDPEDRELEMALRKIGNSKAYRPGGNTAEVREEDIDEPTTSEEEVEEEESDSDERHDTIQSFLQNYERDGDDEQDGNENDGSKKRGADGENNENEEEPKKKRRKIRETLAARDARLKEMEDEVERMEEEALGDKHWSLTGEASAKQRERNSLLELHLDMPMTHFQSKRALDAAVASGQDLEDESDEEGNKPASYDIELMTRQRIADGLFDDVIRKADTRPALKDNKDEETETLNFQKSKLGLGDVYAQQYEQEVFGNASETDVKMTADKLKARELFTKLMFKLDQLTNTHFTPKPIAIQNATSKVSSISMEEAMPLSMSSSTMKAPEEIRSREKQMKSYEDLDRDELAAARRAKKSVRKKKQAGELARGEITMADIKKRQEQLDKKNKTAKEKKLNKGVVKDRQKKVKNSDLLAQAADNAGQTISRKLEMKKWKQKTGDARELKKSRKAKF